MKRLFKSKLFILSVVLAALLAYEGAFRFCTYHWGEIDTDTNPISLYYWPTLPIPGKFFSFIFAPRARLPLGKVPINPKTTAYIDGGIFYIKKNGQWENVTEMFQQRVKEKQKLSVPATNSPLERNER